MSAHFLTFVITLINIKSKLLQTRVSIYMLWCINCADDEFCGTVKPPQQVLDCAVA